jgi:predicted amidohydrolase YtcJ
LENNLENFILYCNERTSSVYSLQNHLQILFTPMPIKSLLPIFSVIFLTQFIMCNRASEATLILYNAVVYTANDTNPVAKAIAIRGDSIVAVGWNEEIKTAFKADRTIDLKGRAVFPGFTDSHAHLEGLGFQLTQLNLAGTNSVEEIQTRVAERVASLPNGAWLRGRSWDQNDWDKKEFPTHEMLDGVAGDHPVYLKRVDGHALWVNKKVLDLANISATTLNPSGGKILRDAQGKPTGVLIDNAMDLVNAVLPPLTTQERTAAIEIAVKECLRFGLTEVHDMGVDAELLDIYKQLIAEKRFPFRVYAAINGLNKTWRDYQTHAPEIGMYDGRLTVRALKLYADGALGSRGAALIQPYTDDPKNKGLLLTPIDSMKKAAETALEKGYQVCVHAIGDGANRNVLNMYEELFKEHPEKSKDVRFRIEHAQVVAMNDIPRFSQLGVLPMMQQTHCTSDMYWAEQRVGSARIKGAYAWRSMIQSGTSVPGGSDFPVESANPLLGFYAAVTRQDVKGFPPDGWYAEQRMTREEALKSYTIWAAYAAFEEKQRGTIEVGKRADIVVLSNDIMKCAPKEILTTKVEYTIVAGEIVYSADAGKIR